MLFELKNFYNFIEAERLKAELSTTAFSTLAMPNHHSAYYPTSRNCLVGSAFVIFSSLKALGFKQMKLTYILEGKTYEAFIDLTPNLSYILGQLLKTARTFSDLLPYGMKVKTLGKLYSRVYLTETYPTFTTFCKIFYTLKVTVAITKEKTVL